MTSAKQIVLVGAAVVVTSAAVARVATKTQPLAPMLPPSQVFYSGVLTDGSGTPVADGAYSVKVELFGSPTGSDSLCEGVQAASAMLVQGRFRVAIDGNCIAALATNPSAFVQVAVSNDQMTTVIPPAGSARPPIGAVPFALQAPAKGVIGIDPTTSQSADMQSALANVFAAAGAAQVPSGTIVGFGGGTPPSGWLLCDGSAVSRTAHAALFTAIGTAWGIGDDSTTFNVPDLRGRFLRGVDSGAARDPDAAARVADNGGTGNGDAVGSIEGDALQNITGTIVSIQGGPPTGSSSASGAMSATSTGFTANAPGGTQVFSVDFDASRVARASSETRPQNADVSYIIKD